MITAEKLRQILDYDPETGVFTWKVKHSKKVVLGAEAGTDCDGYVGIRIDGTRYLAHRLAFLYMTGAVPENITDHKDRNRKNNRWNNLRPATAVENNRNVAIKKSNSSGSIGVYYRKDCNKWQAQARLAAKRAYLGLYETKKEAETVYNNFVKEHYGAFGITN